MSEIIREYRLTDAKAVADIYNEYISARLATLDTELKTETEIRHWMNSFNDRETIIVLERETEIIGWGIIKKYSDRPGYYTTCETSVYLTSNETGKGYGPRMKKELLKRCTDLGYHHLVAKIWATNTTSIEYNRKLGYEIVGTQRQVGVSEGKWIDVVIMQKILETEIPNHLTI